MAFNEAYRAQVSLLVRTLPHIAVEDCLALNGGTAINLFHREMPRLSVDIDLTYVPIAGREESLREIELSLKRVSERLRSVDSRTRITEAASSSQNTIAKIFVRLAGVQVKIEVNPVLRGCVKEPELMEICERGENQFGYVQINTMSFAELFAGKIVAALDRQHPRDFFDIHQLLQNEGINDELRETLIVYLISHERPPAKLLTAESRALQSEYRNNFYGSTEKDIPLDSLLAVHTQLKQDLIKNMSGHHRRFLTSFYRREPEWSLLGIDGVSRLPAVRWKEINLDRAGEDTREAIARQVEEVLA